MRKNNNVSFDDFDVIDDYFEEEGDDILLSTSLEKDYSDVGYEDFNKVEEVSENEYEEEYKENHKEVLVKKASVSSKPKSDFIIYLFLFWTWFRRIGIAIAIILSAYYITSGMFASFFLYILLLVAAFFFGFGFMFLIDKVMEKH